MPSTPQDVRFLGGISRPRENGLSGTKKSLLPCTPLAIIKLMEYLKVYDETLPLGNRMSGKVVVVINRSEIVGRPLAAMLANDGADVYSVDLNGVFLMRRGKMLEARPARPRLAPSRASRPRTRSRAWLRAAGASSPRPTPPPPPQVDEAQEALIRKAHVIVTGVPTKDYRCGAAVLSKPCININYCCLLFARGARHRHGGAHQGLAVQSPPPPPLKGISVSPAMRGAHGLSIACELRGGWV